MSASRINCGAKNRALVRRYSQAVLISTTIVSSMIWIISTSNYKLFKTNPVNSKQNSESSRDDAIKSLPSKDPRLLNYIRKHHVYEPFTLPYNLSHPGSDPSEFKDDLEGIFHGQKNKVFVECGANDGEFLSNTLALERDHGWSGLLIEANPLLIPKLLEKRRKAFVLDVCLSSRAVPQQLPFLALKGNLEWQKGAGKVKPDVYPPPKYFKRSKFKVVGRVECFPLVSILLALNMTRVDYFSLDVEGNEMKILRNIPFALLDIQVMQIEHWLTREGGKRMRAFVESKGYRMYKETKSDFIFIKKRK